MVRTTISNSDLWLTTTEEAWPTRNISLEIRVNLPKHDKNQNLLANKRKMILKGPFDDEDVLREEEQIKILLLPPKLWP